MIRTERMKLLIQAIGADIKAILAKTNLLKTAAYKDVGTTAGKIPEFVGNDGMGGFGFGGRAKDLGLNVNLDTLPKVNAIYGVTKNNVVAGLPADMQAYVYNSEMTLQILVSPNSYYITQVLTAVVYKPPGTANYNAAIFTRCSSFGTWTPWERLSGKLSGVDLADEDVVGDDVEFNSIKVGLTSPKIAFKSVVQEITYENANYKPDGVTPTRQYAPLGAFSIQSGVDEDKVLIMQARVYHIPYGSSYLLQQSENRFGGTYFKEVRTTRGFQMTIYTDEYIASGNAPAGVDSSYSSNKLFTKPSYVELFVIYKVD